MSDVLFIKNNPYFLIIFHIKEPVFRFDILRLQISNILKLIHLNNVSSYFYVSSPSTKGQPSH